MMPVSRRSRAAVRIMLQSIRQFQGCSGYCSSSIPRMFQILLRLGLSVAFEDHIHDGRAVFAMIGLALSLRAVRPTGSSPRTRLARRSSGRKRKIGAGDASHDATDRAAQAEFEANWRRWRNLVERRAIIVRTRPCRNHSVCYALSSARRAVDCICVGSTAPLGRHGLDNGEIELLRQLDSVVRAEPGSERQAPNEDAALQPTSNGR
jgi:hypothetical protein